MGGAQTEAVRGVWHVHRARLVTHAGPSKGLQGGIASERAAGWTRNSHSTASFGWVDHAQALGVVDEASDSLLVEPVKCYALFPASTGTRLCEVSQGVHERWRLVGRSQEDGLVLEQLAVDLLLVSGETEMLLVVFRPGGSGRVCLASASNAGGESVVSWATSS